MKSTSKESKPAKSGKYFGELSPEGQWRWDGTGLPGDDWLAVEKEEKEEPKKPTQYFTSSQLQYDWIELYLTPVTGP
jgi:hypothetical protein